MAEIIKKTKSLTSLLVKDGLVSQEQLLEALEKKEETGKSLARTLVEMGIVSEKTYRSAGPPPRSGVCRPRGLPR